MKIEYYAKNTLFWDENIEFNNSLISLYVNYINKHVKHTSASRDKGKIIIKSSSKDGCRVAYAILHLLFRG